MEDSLLEIHAELVKPLDLNKGVVLEDLLSRALKLFRLTEEDVLSSKVVGKNLVIVTKQGRKLKFPID